MTVAGTKYPVFKTLQGRLTGLKHLETIFKYRPESLPLLELLQAFMQDFSEQYLQAKIQENAFEFSDIAHFAIQILEENADIRELYQNKYHEVMVDEYQDNNHTQERMLELLSNGHNRFMVGISSNPFTASVKPTHRFLTKNLKIFKNILTMGN